MTRRFNPVNRYIAKHSVPSHNPSLYTAHSTMPAEEEQTGPTGSQTSPDPTSEQIEPSETGQSSAAEEQPRDVVLFSRRSTGMRSADSFDTNKISEGNPSEGFGGDSKAWMQRKASTDSAEQTFVPDTGATGPRDEQLKQNWLRRFDVRGGSGPQLSRKSTQQFTDPIDEGDEYDQSAAKDLDREITDSPAPLSPTGKEDDSDEPSGPAAT